MAGLPERTETSLSSVAPWSHQLSQVASFQYLPTTLLPITPWLSCFTLGLKPIYPYIQPSFDPTIHPSLCLIIHTFILIHLNLRPFIHRPSTHPSICSPSSIHSSITYPFIPPYFSTIFLTSIHHPTSTPLNNPSFILSPSFHFLNLLTNP